MLFLQVFIRTFTVTEGRQVTLEIRFSRNLSQNIDTLFKIFRISSFFDSIQFSSTLVSARDKLCISRAKQPKQNLQFFLFWGLYLVILGMRCTGFGMYLPTLPNANSRRNSNDKSMHMNSSHARIQNCAERKETTVQNQKSKVAPNERKRKSLTTTSRQGGDEMGPPPPKTPWCAYPSAGVTARATWMCLRSPSLRYHSWA